MPVRSFGVSYRLGGMRIGIKKAAGYGCNDEGFESLSLFSANKKDHPNGWSFCWQRMRDSNPRKRSQSPVCYRYTNPLSGTVLLYAKFQKSQYLILPFFIFLFPAGRAFPEGPPLSESGRSPSPLFLPAWSGYSAALPGSGGASGRFHGPG